MRLWVCYGNKFQDILNCIAILFKQKNNTWPCSFKEENVKLLLPHSHYKRRYTTDEDQLR